MSVNTEFRPFHETIVGAIMRCDPSPSKGEILRLFEMIKETEILENHDEIIVTIEQYFNFPGGEKWAKEVRLVKESLLSQKRTAEQKSKEKSVGSQALGK